VHSPVHLLFKARALIQLGQLVKARETLLEITREQADKPSPARTRLCPLLSKSGHRKARHLAQELSWR